MLLSRGANPAALFKELRNLGACEVAAHDGEIPDLEAIEPELCYLWWNITLRSSCELNDIRDVFIFVEDDSKLEIERTEPASAPVPNGGRQRTFIACRARAARTGRDAGRRASSRHAAIVQRPSPIPGQRVDGQGALEPA